MLTIKKRHVETVLLVSVFLTTAHLDSLATNTIDVYFPSFLSNYSAFIFWLVTTLTGSFVYLFDSIDLDKDGKIDEDSDPLLYKITTVSFCGALHQTMLTLVIGSTRYIFTTKYFGWILTFINLIIYISLGLLIKMQYKNCLNTINLSPPRTPVSIN